MKLVAKFNLILVILFGVGLAVIAYMSYSFLMSNARDQVLQQAQLMVESASSTREYTAQELTPLLEENPRHLTTFLPQTIPFYAATVTFARLHGKYPDYTYKEAALNPSNPRDRAVEWESDLIQYFRNHPGQRELVGERETPTGRSLYLAHPIAVGKECLDCHDRPETAPATIVQTYGTANGFGWKLNEINAAQIVSVPMTVPVGIANRAFRRLMTYLTVIFLLTLAAMDAALYYMVIRPLRRLSHAADKISKGDKDLPELPVHSTDEIGTVTASFNRMCVSLSKALKMLNE
ncbi:MAG TPA: DUF3365 domain-containing protein [Terriglobales bacterium]|nr:DUF3365 domain-containing protein [Terriglobales bacterium]